MKVFRVFFNHFCNINGHSKALIVNCIMLGTKVYNNNNKLKIHKVDAASLIAICHAPYANAN